MKYIVVLLDGAADYPIKSLGGKTPLEVANKPNINSLAKKGEVGMVEMVPKDLSPGSDVANLSVLGYNPHKYYTGRSPLESVSMGITLKDTDTTFRANIVTLSEDANYEDKIMIDYSAGEISTKDAAVLIDALNQELKNDVYEFYSGISYRHLLLWHERMDKLSLTPPHDISGKCIKKYLPQNEKILSIIKKSNKILNNHPLNKQKISKGEKSANSIWIWGQGTKTTLPSFYDKYQKKGCVISAVDLVKGIGISAGMDTIEVEGATGTLNTNFERKADAAIDALKKGYDFVYLHLEAPDECGHHFETENKIKAIELIDKKVVGRIINYLKEQKDDYSILILPDHATPIELGKHTNDPIPYIIYVSNNIKNGVDCYCESAAKHNKFSQSGYKLMDYFIRNGGLNERFS